jgi:hypothetical protein
MIRSCLLKLSADFIPYCKLDFNGPENVAFEVIGVLVYIRFLHVGT